MQTLCFINLNKISDVDMTVPESTMPLLGNFGRGWMLARACLYWDMHC